jgi:hypothetical protein
MILSSRVKSTKIIINIVALVLVYFFSFHIFPKLGIYNKLDYIDIKTNGRDIFYLDDYFYSNRKRAKFADKKKYLIQEQNKFLRQYLDYFSLNSNLIANAPCPAELMTNNLRNIQVYTNYYIDPLDDDVKFNVRFTFYKLFKFTDKLNIDKCFDYIFKENLNKYFLSYRNKLIANFNDEINLQKKLGIDNPTIETSTKLIEKMKTYNLYIDPDVSYTVDKKNDETSTKIITLIICLLIVLSINISFNKLNKKLISKIIKIFIFK